MSISRLTVSRLNIVISDIDIFTMHQRQTDEPRMMKMMMNSSTTGSPPDEIAPDGVTWQKTVTLMGDKLEGGYEPCSSDGRAPDA